jgi:hypothetical protein
MVVRTSLVPSSEYALRTIRFPVNNPAIIKLTHYQEAKTVTKEEKLVDFKKAALVAVGR